MRTHAEWNVHTHIAFTTGPTSAATRCFISSAALLVNVMARMAVGGTPSWMRWAMRWVSTRVLPEPAPATTSSGPTPVHDGVELVGVQPTQIQRVEIELKAAVVAHGAAILRRGCDTPASAVGPRR